MSDNGTPKVGAPVKSEKNESLCPCKEAIRNPKQNDTFPFLKDRARTTRKIE